MERLVVIVLAGLTAGTFGQTLLCDDIDTSACRLMEASRPDLCSDPEISKRACPRYCKMCPIECYNCNATVMDYHECNTTMLCGTNEVCMIKELKSFIDGHHEYEMTCELKQVCDGGGLEIPFGKRDLESRDLSISCCDSDLCNYPKAAGCPKDIVFLVDESSRVLKQDQTLIVNAMVNVIRQLSIGSSANMIGLYGYDTSIHTKFPLDKYQDKTDLLQAVQNANLFSRFHLQRTDTAEAIAFLVDHALTTQQGDRPAYPDAVVIIGDPITASISSVSFGDRLALAGKSQDVIVVSVGSRGDDTEQLASDRNHMIHVPTISAFDSVLTPKLVELLLKC